MRMRNRRREWMHGGHAIGDRAHNHFWREKRPSDGYARRNPM